MRVETPAHASTFASAAGAYASPRSTASGRFPRPMSMRLTLTSWVLTAAVACSSSSTPLSVLAAAGAKPALDEIVRSFERERGDEIEVSYGGGGQLLARMVFIEKGDVYVAPEEEFMSSAVKQAAVDPATIRDVAYMVPVLAVTKRNPKHLRTLSDLTGPGIRVAVTRPETTCLGRYSPEILRRAGLSEAIGEKIVTHAPRPDLLMAWLVLGKVDAIITWHFYGELARDDIEVIWLPPEQLPGIGKMQAAVATYTGNRDLARDFVEFLASAHGKAVFKKHGYIVDAATLSKHSAGVNTHLGNQARPSRQSRRKGANLPDKREGGAGATK